MNSLIGKKIHQTQKFLEDGRRIPVTEVFVGQNRVVLVKNKDKHGYSAVQLGFGEKPYLKEVRYSDGDGLPNVGDVLKVPDVFAPGDVIDVLGVSKGKGYAGVVKRHHFKGGPRTHGQSDRERAPGSIGQTTTPGRVYKGKRMAGRMGNDNVTVKNLKVIDVSDTTLFIKGLIPGVVNSMVFITKRGQDKKFVPLYKEEVSKGEAEVSKVSEGEVQPEVTAQAQEEVKAEAQSEPEAKVQEEQKVESASAEASADKEEGAENAS